MLIRGLIASPGLYDAANTCQSVIGWRRTLHAEEVTGNPRVVPGSGTFGMEAVARKFATREGVIIRNGVQLSMSRSWRGGIASRW